LAVVAGRQLATREGLEVLALGTTELPTKRMPLEEAVAWAQDASALPVIPWGFGKWTLGRGKKIREAIAWAEPSQVFFGDNGGRLRGFPTPALLDRAVAHGFRVLPGSDPLPLPGQGTRAGSAGIAVEGEIDFSMPFSSFVSAVARDADAYRFMDASGLPAFLTNQTRMILQKHLGRGGTR
jgi:hypothetical protein